ncbi:MAG: hypothetical protein LBO82_08380 [Synergistaceae bacterium]|jgi:hypothetical protein|nr:hypothetical protein [Synergistaceae bacterium]
MNGKRKGGVLAALVFAVLGLFRAESAAAALPVPGTLPVSWDALSYYQLRDVSGVPDGHTVAGSQWFATVIEMWRDTGGGDWIYRKDTHGGQAPAVTMVTSADLVRDFASVYLEDPLHDTSRGDDLSFDPIESVALVIKEGNGALKLDFGNDYAHHDPFSFAGPQDAMEDVLLYMPENEYTTRVLPGRPSLVASRDWLHTEMRLQALSPQDYGSSLGYLTFRQSASFDRDFLGYRESIEIPLVVANVYDGPASDAGSELRFDITVLRSEDVVTRKRFLWGADEDRTQDLGTFFFIQPPAEDMPVYMLRNRVTNRTGTRYRQQRYDTGGTIYQDIIPDHWLYDIPPDLYGTLPKWFYLDPQSQIAPGLVTQYSASMDMAYTSEESFRLYPFQGAQPPRDLRLTFRKVRGMTPYGPPLNGRPVRGTVPWTATAFHMAFADVAENNENTVRELSRALGGRPVMPDPAYTFDGAADTYIKADAFNAFAVSADVPAGLIVSSDDIALLPVHVRLRVSRKESPIVGRWEELENAESVIDEFAKTCAVWVRSPNAAEKDINLFAALSDRGYGVSRCVQAFTYEDFLYIDFIAFAADAKSRNAGKTALLEVVEDDGIPYILLGDGAIDGVWTLSFFAGQAGGAPIVEPDPDPDPKKPDGGDSGGGGGGGCSAGLLFPALLTLPVLLRGRVRLRKP